VEGVKKKQLQRLVQSSGPMTRFCYAYTRLLLDKLLQLQKNDAVFKGGHSNAQRIESNHGHSTDLTELAIVVINQLEIQVSSSKDPIGSQTMPFDINRLAEFVSKYLAIFEDSEGQPTHRSSREAGRRFELAVHGGRDPQQDDDRVRRPRE